MAALEEQTTMDKIKPTLLHPETPDGNKLSKKASLKLQKKSYRIEKKKVSSELKHTIQDPSVVMLSDWLKGRTTLKNWTRIYCVLKPGVMVIYRTDKSKHWIGTVLLTNCEVIERPSKKEGFCFKIYHPLNQSIWAIKGPKGESMGVLKNTFPSGCLILRASSDSDGHCWMDAVELAQRCSSLLKKSISAAKSTNHGDTTQQNNIDDSSSVEIPSNSEYFSPEIALDLSLLQQQLSQLKRDHTGNEDSNTADSLSDGSGPADTHRRTASKTSSSSAPPLNEVEQYSADSSYTDDDGKDNESLLEEIHKTTYIPDEAEDFGEVGEASQTEVLAGENKSLVWTLLKQLRPGMDLSKVVLPTFILEPRSFLDKLTDYYYHVDLLSKAVEKHNPYERMKGIAKWYLSGFYKKPKGLKKPYNPILGETFRCKWIDPNTDSTTYYLAEQISHHPPISNFVVINRRDGFAINASILTKSKFYGNSLSAILDGEAKLLLLKLGEEYRITMPYAHCKGILYGTMTMEFGGKVSITCDKTGYTTELDFKLKPFFGGSDAVNKITGRILFGRKVLATMNGFWDQKVEICDAGTKTTEVFWEANSQIRNARLPRYVVAMDEQGQFESQKLWRHVTKAIRLNDQIEATNQKYILEEAQRKAARDRHNNAHTWVPKFFEKNEEDDTWSYKYIDTRAWDDLNDIEEYEYDGRIATQRKLKTPKINDSLTQSIANLHVKPTCDRWSMDKSSESNQSEENFMLQKISPKRMNESLSELKRQQSLILNKLNELEVKMNDLGEDIKVKQEVIVHNKPPLLFIFAAIVVLIAILVYFIKQ